MLVITKLEILALYGLDVEVVLRVHPCVMHGIRWRGGTWMLRCSAIRRGTVTTQL